MATVEDIRWEPSSRSHERENFDCGNPALDRWLRQYARRNQERGACLTEVLVPAAEPEHIIGFVSLSGYGLDTSSVPDSLHGFDHLKQVPAVLLARMGRDALYRDQGIGDMLLSRARESVAHASARIGIALIVVDAKHGKAGWYEERGFIRSKDEADRLLLPVKSIK